MEIAGSAALVSGAASGLGAATAAALAAGGATVYGLDLPAAVGGATAPDGVTLLPADVTEEDGVRAALARIDDDGQQLRLAVNCADYPPEIVTYEDFVAKTLLGRVVAPHTQGASEAWLGLLACMRWPVPVTYLPHSIMVRGAPPILLVGSTHDPETNYVWAHELRNQMPSAVLLTRDGDGHTSSFLQNSRTSDAIAHYLITRQTPPPNTVYPD